MQNSFNYIRLIFNVAFNDKRLGFVYGVIFVCCFAPLLGVMDAKAALIIEMVIFWGMLLIAVLSVETERLIHAFRHRGFMDCTVAIQYINSEKKTFNLSLPKEWAKRNIDTVEPVTASANICNLLKGQL